MNRYRDLTDTQFVERCDKALLSGFCRELLNEVIRRWDPDLDPDDRPDEVYVWCTNCDWEKVVEPQFNETSPPVRRATAAAAGHIGNQPGCEHYELGTLGEEVGVDR